MKNMIASILKQADDLRVSLAELEMALLGLRASRGEAGMPGSWSSSSVLT